MASARQEKKKQKTESKKRRKGKKNKVNIRQPVFTNVYLFNIKFWVFEFSYKKKNNYSVIKWQIILKSLRYDICFCYYYYCCCYTYLPMVTSLQLPRRKYTKHPMKPEYRPYCGGKPATTAYAIPCGIAVRPTVKPATKSWNK